MGPNKQKLKKELPGGLDALCVEKQVPQTEVYTLLSELASAYSLFHPHANTRSNPLPTEFTKLRPNQTNSRVLQGYYEYLNAYEVRGRADQVPPAQRKAFEDRPKRHVKVPGTPI